MSDFLSELLVDAGAVVRAVTFKGKTGDVHFRRISAGQKAEMQKGLKVQTVHGQKSTVEIDLGQNARSKALLVQYSVLKPDGTPQFRSLKEAEAIDAGLLDALHAVASDVNKDELGIADGDDAGKD